MATIDEREQQRLEQKARLDTASSAAERNRFGQFATPTALATDILAYAKSLLPPRTRVRFLDPAVGTGSFYSALLRVFPKSRITRAAGVEIDSEHAAVARRLWAGSGLALRVEDFTAAAPPQAESDKATLVICNPPYVRHHHLAPADKQRLQRRALCECGIRFSGLAGLYCYFVCCTHRWMARGGLAGWLIPSEFMDVNYGRALRDYLLSRVTLVRVHRFDPAEMQFADALVSSAVVCFRNKEPPAEHTVEFSHGGTLLQPRTSIQVTTDELRKATKWSAYALRNGAADSPANGTVLGNLFSIKRGLATGANKFFILTPEDAGQRGLPPEVLTPILPSPRYLEADEVQADDCGNPLVARQQVLVDCRLPPDSVRRKYAALWAYLQEGVKAGVHERYLCKHRSPWYVQEARPPAPFLCTYMGRGSGAGRGPFRFILNHSRATAANTYLLLYPKGGSAKALRDDPTLIAAVWRALQGIGSDAIKGAGRVYGGGLHKVEPKELASVPARAVAAKMRRAEHT